MSRKLIPTNLLPLPPPPAPPPATPYPDPIERLIPFGSICTLSGASGVGKTAFCASVLLTTINTGQPLFGYPTHKPPEIGMIVCDRPWRDHAAWFARAGCPEPKHLSLRDMPTYKWEGLRNPHTIQAEFDRLLSELALAPGSLLLVDPLPLFIPGRLIDYKDVAIGLGLIDQVVQRHQLTLLGVFHVSKQKADKNTRYLRPQDRILGSSGLIGYSETAFYLLSPEEAEQPTYELGAISHQLPPIVINYMRDENGLFVPAHDLDRIVNYSEVVLSCFPPTGTTIAASILISAITRATKCVDRTAYGHLKDLVREGRVRKVGKGLYERAPAN